MKRAKLFPAVLLCLLLFSGCARKSAPALPEADYPMEFLFSSGAGAWRTELTLSADGSFYGHFSDSNMGELGKDHPKGTVYVSTFTGRFSAAEKLDIHSYPLTLEELTSARPEGEEWVEDGVRYVSSTPYGLEGGTEFVLYTPTAPVFGLDEDLLSWWPGRFEDTPPKTLNCYALWNVEAGTAFFACPQTMN